ncbi:MAG: hypothetical protein IPN71_13750 [Fibrobacteres bacterium]|nr:hypothetical protein [Fibrobacterota bacterium]
MKCPIGLLLALWCLSCSKSDPWTTPQPQGVRKEFSDTACIGDRSRILRYAAWQWDSESQVAELDDRGRLRFSGKVIGSFDRAHDSMHHEIQLPPEEYHRVREWLLLYEPETSMPVVDGSVETFTWCDDSAGHAASRTFTNLDALAPKAKAFTDRWQKRSGL